MNELAHSSLATTRGPCSLTKFSMINPFFLEKLDRIARIVRARDEPMGGMQLVMCGDFLQLAPVHKSNTKTLQTTYAFQAPCWETFNFSMSCIYQSSPSVGPGFVRSLRRSVLRSFRRRPMQFFGLPMVVSNWCAQRTGAVSITATEKCRK